MRRWHLHQALVAWLFIFASAEHAYTQSPPAERLQITVRPPSTKVLIQVGSQKQELDAPRVAALFAQYALLAANVKNPDLGPLPPPSPPNQRPEQMDANPVQAAAAATLTGATGWLRGARGWRWENADATALLTCPPNRPLCGRGFRLAGLEMQFWKRVNKNGACREAAIVFGGTDFNQLADWVSNLRPLFRWPPVEDQYDQVRSGIHAVVAEIAKHRCATIIAVGHSLGGGLAQHAAYAAKEIRYVYAFDPSPLTGALDFEPEVRKKNTQGLFIDRVYERGEILSFLRAPTETILPPPECNPRVRRIAFDVEGGNPLAQHDIAPLATQLFAWRQETGTKRRQAAKIIGDARPRRQKECPGDLY